MIKEFKIAQMFKENVCLGGKSNGQFLRNEVEIAMDTGKVYVDFEGLPLITQSFSDEFLGPLVAEKGRDILKQITFRHCAKDIQIFLASTVRRFAKSKQATPS